MFYFTLKHVSHFYIAVYMMMMNLPAHIFNEHIEPYTRRPQPKELCDDIISFHVTLEQLREFYAKVIQRKSEKDYEGSITNYVSFYHEFLKGLSILCEWNYFDFYCYKMLEVDVRVCRTMWGQLLHNERLEMFKELRALEMKFLRRPGDPF